VVQSDNATEPCADRDQRGTPGRGLHAHRSAHGVHLRRAPTPQGEIQGRAGRPGQSLGLLFKIRDSQSNCWANILANSGPTL
jgi:hypothetical protein